MILSAQSTLPAQSERRSRSAVSVSVASVALLAVSLAGCSSSGTTSGGAATTPPVSTPMSAPASAPVVSDSAAGSVAPSVPATPASGTPADPATKKAVSTTYETFFTPSTSPSVAQAELQNGAQFTSSLAALAKTAKQQNTSVTVSAVTVAGPVATVTFTLYGGNHAPLLPNTHGLAVLVNGKWQVAAQTFCALVGLQGAAPPACKDPKYTALPH